MKTQLAMVIDSSKCIDCKACTVACKVENQVPEGHWRNWVKHAEPDADRLARGGKDTAGHFQPGACMHCEEPTCVRACPTGATYKDEADGSIRVDSALCIGCGSCIPACPYGARYRHPEKKIVDKCDYCSARRARGELPACVVTCPTKARTFGNLHDPKSEAAILMAANSTVRVANPESDTRPNMYYIGATAPLNWPVKAQFPAPISIWAKLAKPLIWGAVGLNALGVLVMLGKQVLMADDAPEAEDPENQKEATHG